MVVMDETVQWLFEQCRRDHIAWINGDATGYQLPEERATIMGAFGSTGVGASNVKTLQHRAAAQFDEGSGTVELALLP